MTVAVWSFSTVVAAQRTVTSELAELFARYNTAVWPGHLVAYTAGVGALVLLVWRPGATASRTVSGLLAVAWLWLGVVFHGFYATDLDPVLGGAYAVAFIAQAVLLFRAGVLHDDLAFTTGRGSAAVAGWASLAYAVVIYPLIGIGLGHGYPEAPLLGMAPCPTTIATFGLLLLARPPLPRHLLPIPVLWAVLGPLGAVPQGMIEDTGLFAVGMLAVTVIVVRDRHPAAPRAVHPSAP